MSKRAPICHVIAGPNGAGKTTFAMDFLPRIAGCRNFINADMMARGLSPLNADAAAMAAGRLFLHQIQLQIESRKDFAFETTLSGLTYIRHLQEMKRIGYSIHLYFLWIPTVRLTLKRIAERVRSGGHNIPQEVATRRFHKGLVKLFSHYEVLADTVALFDNSSVGPRLVYERIGEQKRMLDRTAYDTIREQAGVKP